MPNRSNKPVAIAMSMLISFSTVFFFLLFLFCFIFNFYFCFVCLFPKAINRSHYKLFYLLPPSMKKDNWLPDLLAC